MSARPRGHTLHVTRARDWTEGDPFYDWTIECHNIDLCGGWIECREYHGDADGGPWECGQDDPWAEQEEYEFHGVTHTWRYEHDWTVPYHGCVPQIAGDDSAREIAYHKGEGSWLIGDDWDDDYCYLTVIGDAS